MVAVKRQQDRATIQWTTLEEGRAVRHSPPIERPTARLVILDKAGRGPTTTVSLAGLGEYERETLRAPRW